MRQKIENAVRVEGRVYDINLDVKEVSNEASDNFGKKFIGGTIDVATDEDTLNVVSVHFTYVPATWPAKNGKPERVNDTYTTLTKIIESGKTVLADGKDAATMVRIDTSIALNDFYTNRDGEEKLVSAKRAEGGFVRIINKLGKEDARSTFKADMVINGTTLIEENPDKNIKEHLVVKGAVFNFRKDFLPVDFCVYNPDGIKYFESLDASSQNLVFTQVWGEIKSQNIVTQTIKESAFGGPSVTEYERTIREWIIVGTLNEPYEIGDEQNGITLDELKEAIAKREVTLAEIKKRNDEYQASKANGSAAASTATQAPAAGGFNF